eukprot:CAMPEP_0178491678 /NCGR_PEP_ID=MMETSP0696-20121128/11537_1 /TAXON_ID=265572 /ORGANISM="Extubocellulus spinifer, Strain CCMP396" /LENGTH=333 /DNA_ID=CAMNT_0020119561 /DNA_START=501 /DNA_END=1502 /DNA_ORIENTATION=+
MPSPNGSATSAEAEAEADADAEAGAEAAAAQDENSATASTSSGGRRRIWEGKDLGAALALAVKEEELKRTRTYVCEAAQNLACVITHELPIDPVTAEDGFFYEEREIKEWIRRKKANGQVLTSPRTNAPMGTNLFPAIQVRDTIRELVSNGVIDGELAEQWKKSMDDREKVEKTKKMAEDGDVNSMLELGKCYEHGSFGLLSSNEEAYKWYKRAADLKDTQAMAKAGWMLVQGAGVAKCVGHGVLLTTSAAERGSDYACDSLGRWYQDGLHSISGPCYSMPAIPRDRKEAIYWYRRATDGSCSVQHMASEDLKRAKANLQELEAKEIEHGAVP